jgi:sensor histidine kinase YesM
MKITKLNRGKLVLDIIFCTVSYFVLLGMFALSSEIQMIDHIYTSIFLGTLILASSINAWLIIPKFLNRKRYAIWFISFLLNLIACTLFNHVLFDSLIDYILPGYYFISYYELIDLFKFFLAFVTLATLLHLSWEWFELQDSRHRLTVIEKEKATAELQALMGQVNPHFLFNSLTVLYGLSLKKSEDTSDAIVKLSDILRYVIYESAKGKVSVSSEIELIKNYIALQQYRVTDQVRIEFDDRLVDSKVELEPMLLLPLLENSFKHGIKGDIGPTFIEMKLMATAKEIQFRITNNKAKAPSAEQSWGGIGLKNIRERLRLVYPGRHTFSVHETDSIFSVDLIIQN